MGLKGRLKRLERLAEGKMIAIPQQDGSADALVNVMKRLGAGEEAPPEHPLLEAARNSSDRWWRESLYAVNEDIATPVPDLSE